MIDMYMRCPIWLTLYIVIQSNVIHYYIKALCPEIYNLKCNFSIILITKFGIRILVRPLSISVLDVTLNLTKY